MRVLALAVVAALTAAPFVAAAQDAPANPLGKSAAPQPAAPPIDADSDEEAGTSDEAIEQRLTGIFSQVDELEGVTATVRSGVVRLQGKTPGAESRKQAADLARRIDGVVFVDNDIAEATDVGERIVPALERFTSWATTLRQRAPIYAVALGVVAVFAVLARIVRSWRAPFRWLVRRRIFRDVVQQIAAFGVFVVGLVVALEIVEATALVGAVLGAAGLAGIALGFAFRDIAENYLASILLGLRRPFGANDHVVIEEHEGKVIRLTMRETLLMTLDGHHVSLPNALVFKSIIVNYTANPLRRFHFPVGVGVTSDLVEAQAIGNEALRGTPGVAAEPPPFTRVEELGDSNVVVRLHGWVDQREADWFKVRSEAVRRVKSAFDARGIEMPVPTQRIQLEALEAQAEEREREQRRDCGRAELARVAHEVVPDDVLERQIASEVRAGARDDLLQDDRRG